MSGMVERIARAIYAVGPGYLDEGRISDEVLARAAIEAMREPTPEMIKAWGNTPNIGMNWEDYARDKWRAMIQAALDEI